MYASLMAKDIADNLRVAIERSGLSENELAQKAGVPQPVVNRFMNGGDMKLRNASKLARVLGLELRRKPEKRKP